MAKKSRRIARRVAKIDASGIRRVFDLAAGMKNPVNFSIGQPDFDIADPVKEAAIEAIRKGFNKYTVTQGIPELREVILQRVALEYNWEPEGLLITSGVSGGLVLALLALVEEGDEVLIPDPYFVMYKHLVNLCGGVARFVSTYPDFHLKAERIERHLTERCKVLILNSPSNPTGVVLTADELRDIAALAEERGIFIITDEIYKAFCYDSPYQSIIRWRRENVLLLDGFSKSYGFTGWRLGYAAGPADVIQEMTKLQQYSFVCAPSIVQYAGVKALETDISKEVEMFRRRRDLLCEGLDRRYEVQKPGGAFYIFPRVPWGSDTEFCEEAIRRNLLIIPGSVFSEKNTHFRISYATSISNIERGIEILNAMI